MHSNKTLAKNRIEVKYIRKKSSLHGRWFFRVGSKASCSELASIKNFCFFSSFTIEQKQYSTA